ncbi:MAG: iron-sulfur cluster assembly accessory protein [Verrucomicrobiota bacterium]|nr:iron-sulfur cluster assembly accessory protein [Verrucomicrobiota bacterium]
MQATQQAFQQVMTMLSDQGLPLTKALRISIEDGGCSGRQYVMKIDDPGDSDFVLTNNDVKIIIDPISHDLLKDCMVDYVDTLSDSGFKIQNPLAKRSCGCGKSFEA